MPDKPIFKGVLVRKSVSCGDCLLASFLFQADDLLYQESDYIDLTQGRGDIFDLPDQLCTRFFSFFIIDNMRRLIIHGSMLEIHQAKTLNLKAIVSISIRFSVNFRFFCYRRIKFLRLFSVQNRVCLDLANRIPFLISAFVALVNKMTALAEFPFSQFKMIVAIAGGPNLFGQLLHLSVYFCDFICYLFGRHIKYDHIKLCKRGMQARTMLHKYLTIDHYCPIQIGCSSVPSIEGFDRTNGCCPLTSCRQSSVGSND
ncbi:hypothetical protein DF043_36585 [Burkholderia cepacia]|nr:hypothetical protein DF043_36585 [Burkholderia cepacia]